jgi:hypothetical protein
MKTSIYLFERTKGIKRKRNIFLREIASTNDFLELKNLYRSDIDGNCGLELYLNFLGNRSTVYPNDNNSATSHIIDWTEGPCRFVGQYVSGTWPVIMEFHDFENSVHLFYNNSYSDLQTFVDDFKNSDNTDNQLAKSFEDAFNLLNGLQ